MTETCYRICLALGAVLALAAGAAAQTTPDTSADLDPAEALAGLRPPAVPLIACDPYFSVWSEFDHLTDGPTRHWTGSPHRMTSLVRVDGKAYRLMGDEPKNVPAMEQTDLLVWPTRTVYGFAGDGVRVTLTFTTPLLPTDLDVLSRPLTYLTWTAESTDGKAHDVAVYFDASSEFAVHTPDQIVTWDREQIGDLTALSVGTVEQPMLQRRGDGVRIDWGYFYVAADAGKAKAALAPAAKARKAFANGNKLPKDVSTEQAPVEDGAPVLAMAFDLGKVSDEAVERRVMVAYDDLYSIRYFQEDLRPYWRRNGADAADLLKTADAEYEELIERCKAFDREVVTDLIEAGGKSYAQLGVLSYRQALAAQKLVADANGQPIMMSKENYSNGCIATVDVLYPASPQMMVFAPTLLKASLLPLMDYSASELWQHDAAPHDLGTYPQATGQVYGGGGSPMPVEECGNMLIMMAGLSTTEGDAAFADRYWPTLTKWYNYLVEHGLDPENQLSTDDFAGHLARNANLSVKAIMGIASYGRLCELTGRDEEAQKAFAIARDYAKQWMELAGDGDHYALAFGQPGTWSQKYNLVWDELLGFNVFPDEVVEKEIAFYRDQMNRYGLPLDSRRDYTKLDWEIWTATMADDPADFQRIIDAVAKWANETPARSPMTDWYGTIDGKRHNFTARSVVGGTFIALMRDKDVWMKYANRDPMKTGEWAPIPIDPPEMDVYVPAADQEPATWRYTTRRPASGWQAENFDDSNWQTGQSGFGTEGTPNAHVGTTWDTSDVYLRRTIELPENLPQNPHLWLAHDEDVEVYINGVLAVRVSGFRNEYAPYRMRSEAVAALRPGQNVIAVHCHQTGGGQYVDVGLVDLIEDEPAND